VEHFGNVADGTGIRFYKGALYTASATGIYWFTFNDNGALTPGKDPGRIWRSARAYGASTLTKSVRNFQPTVSGWPPESAILTRSISR
jgi:hypothetical protein